MVGWPKKPKITLPDSSYDPIDQTFGSGTSESVKKKTQHQQTEIGSAWEKAKKKMQGGDAKDTFSSATANFDTTNPFGGITGTGSLPQASIGGVDPTSVLGDNLWKQAEEAWNSGENSWHEWWRKNIGGPVGDFMDPDMTTHINRRTNAGGYTPNSNVDDDDPYAGMTKEQRAVSEHLEDIPQWEQDAWGEGGYDPDKYGYDAESYEFDEDAYYDPTKLGSEGYELGYLEAQDFDPYRRNALQNVTATSASDQASAEGALARTGGLSASDRMAMASQFNRDKIEGRSQSLGKYDEMESSNLYNVGKANVGIDNTAAEINAAAQTSRDKASSELAHETRNEEIKAANLRKKEDAARRYKEAVDKYENDYEIWAKEGEFMASGAKAKDKPVKPKASDYEVDPGPVPENYGDVPGLLEETTRSR